MLETNEIVAPSGQAGREIETERSDRQTGRQTHSRTHTHIKTKRERDRQTDRETERERQREREREAGRQARNRTGRQALRSTGADREAGGERYKLNADVQSVPCCSDTSIANRWGGQ